MASADIGGGSSVRWDAGPMLEKVTAVLPSLLYVFNQKTSSNEYTNRNLAEMLGYEPAEIQAMKGDFLPALFHPDDLPRVFSHFGAIQNLPDGEIAQLVYRVRHRNGEWRYLLSHDSVFERDADGSVLRHIGVASDVTAQKRAEASLHEANTALAATNAELEQLTFVATHDMKAAINNISGITQALRESVDPGNEEVHEMLSLLEKTVARAGRTLRDVVTVAQNREQMRAAPSSVQAVGALLVDVVRSMRPSLDELGATVAVVESDPGARVQFSPLHLRSIVENLLQNALKYRSPDRPLRVRLSTAVVGDRVRLSCEDNGIGIDLRRDRERIFKLFQRGGNYELDGSGIGLYLVKQMVLRAGGTITVESAVGEGAVFTLTFEQAP